MRWLVGVGLFALCLLLLWTPRAGPRGLSWMLFRCFFPSWRFFEDVAPGPVLSYCWAAPDRDFGAWHEAGLVEARGPLALLWNARGNLELARRALVDQLWSELEADPSGACEDSLSYRLVQRLVYLELLRPEQRAPRSRYRFRLAPNAGGSEPEEFVSAIHEL